MAVPRQVQDIVTDYLAAMDKALPGLIQGLYLVGSLTLHDFHLKASDIDFVAVTERPVDRDKIDTICRVHRKIAKRHRRPQFNGPYVTWAELTDDPKKTEPGVFVGDNGRVRLDSRNARNPITWQTLSKYGTTLRGPEVSNVRICSDQDGLIAFVRENLDTYWRRWHQQGSRLLSKSGLLALTNWGAVWVVLGVSRLHYTLATGEITSKAGAGEYAREIFPAQWHKIIDESLRIRRELPERSLYRSAMARRRDVLAFLNMVITDVQLSDNTLGRRC